MLNSLYVSLPLAILLGCLTGLGTGGGSLLLIWLTLVLQMDPQEARIINLMFFIPPAVTSCILRILQGNVAIKKIFLPSLAGCITAAIIALYCRNMDTYYLKKAFGILLIVTGIREIGYQRFRKPR